MSAVPNEMPLLPMPAVLFPGTFMPVQVTDARHRELLRHCAEQNQQLGILLNPGYASGGSPMLPRTTGCLATVALLLDTDDKDMMGAVLYGEQRMRVTTFTQHQPYVTGEIELLEDFTGMNAERRSKQAAQLFTRYLELVSERYSAQTVNMPLPDDPIMASYLLAAVLYLPLEQKQRWLESNSAAFRLQEELAYLHAECERLSTILALSQHTQRQYATPDPRLFSSLVSQN